jgi:hypothetical protein
VKVVEMRCTSSPRRLFAKMKVSGERPMYVLPDNLIEFSCRDCTARERRLDPSIVRVVHRFNIAGEHVESTALWDDDVPGPIHHAEREEGVAR